MKDKLMQMDDKIYEVAEAIIGRSQSFKELCTSAWDDSLAMLVMAATDAEIRNCKLKFKQVGHKVLVYSTMVHDRKMAKDAQNIVRCLDGFEFSADEPRLFNVIFDKWKEGFLQPTDPKDIIQYARLYGDNNIKLD